MNELFFNIIIIIIGLTTGIIIGYLLFKKINYIGPNSNEIMKKIMNDENGSFRYIPQITICPINYSMNLLKDKNFIIKD